MKSGLVIFICTNGESLLEVGREILGRGPILWGRVGAGRFIAVKRLLQIGA